MADPVHPPPTDAPAETPPPEGPTSAPPSGDTVARGDGGDLLGDLLGRVLRRGRLEMGRAARQARDRLALRQLRLDRDRMYQKLGKEVVLLLESGELAHPSLARAMERIRDLEGRIHEQEDRLRSLGLDPEEEPPTNGEGG